MGKKSTGTVTDEDRLIALQTETHDGDVSFVLEVTEIARRADVPVDGLVEWTIDESDEIPMLVFNPLPSGEESDAIYVAEVSDEGRETRVAVPPPLLQKDARGRGLGLDLDAYDPDNPLLFEVAALEETVGLLPVRFGDGTIFRGEFPTQMDTERDSDPVAEAEVERSDRNEGKPRSETITAPIDAAVVKHVVREMNVSRGELIDALEALARHDLVDESDAVAGYDPFAVENRVVAVVSDDKWDDELAPALGIEDDDIIEAARTAHNRQAEILIDAAGADDHRDFGEEHDAVVSAE